MRLKVLLIFVIVYILSAFVWLTFSLLNSSNTDFQLKKDVLRAGLNACTLQVIEKAKNKELGMTPQVTYRLKQLEMNINEDLLNTFVQRQFKHHYTVSYVYASPQVKLIQLAINPMQIEILDRERLAQQKIWVYQSILLLFLVGLGIYGVLSSLDRIYKLNKQQNNFLLSVTHEFKTPIAAIRLMLETSKHPKIEITKQSELVDRSIQSTYRLEELAENMLTAMQIESNAYSYNLETVNWSELIRNSIQNQSINGEIRAEIANRISVQGDDFILRMVINNLIENAFKYSGNNPIEVSLKQEGKWKVLSIKDQGIGIRKKDLKNIFKKFYRVQDEETRIAKGTGLGLFIVKQAIEKHQGRVEVVSEINKGTEFKIFLP